MGAAHRASPLRPGRGRRTLSRIFFYTGPPPPPPAAADPFPPNPPAERGDSSRHGEDLAFAHQRRRRRAEGGPEPRRAPRRDHARHRHRSRHGPRPQALSGGSAAARTAFSNTREGTQHHAVGRNLGLRLRRPRRQEKRLEAVSAHSAGLASEKGRAGACSKMQVCELNMKPYGAGEARRGHQRDHERRRDCRRDDAKRDPDLEQARQHVTTCRAPHSRRSQTTWQSHPSSYVSARKRGLKIIMRARE